MTHDTTQLLPLLADFLELDLGDHASPLSEASERIAEELRADECAIYGLSPTPHRLLLYAGSGWATEPTAHYDEIDFSSTSSDPAAWIGITSFCASERHPILVEDVDIASTVRVNGQAFKLSRDSFGCICRNPRSCIVVPILFRKKDDPHFLGGVVRVVRSDSPEVEPFTKKDMEKLLAMAKVVAPLLSMSSAMTQVLTTLPGLLTSNEQELLQTLIAQVCSITRADPSRSGFWVHDTDNQYNFVGDSGAKNDRRVLDLSSTRPSVAKIVLRGEMFWSGNMTAEMKRGGRLAHLGYPPKEGPDVTRSYLGLPINPSTSLSAGEANEQRPGTPFGARAGLILKSQRLHAFSQHDVLCALLFSKRAEKLLSERNRRVRDVQGDSIFETIIRSSPDAIVATDAGGRIIQHNRAAARLVGFDTKGTDNAMVGKDVVDEFYDGRKNLAASVSSKTSASRQLQEHRTIFFRKADAPPNAQASDIRTPIPVVMTCSALTDSAENDAARSATDDKNGHPTHGTVALSRPIIPLDRICDVVEFGLSHTAGETSANAGATRGLTADPAMISLIRRAESLIAYRNPVVLMGETGVGKEILAKHLFDRHRQKHRQAPWVTFNCACGTETTIEAELFGTAKNAFTQVDEKPGLIEAANHGTLFLDEIGEMPLTTQARLLRVFNDWQVRRVGGSVNRPVEIEVVCATNADLEAAVREGRFRRDLYARLGGETRAIRIPPLRERPADILLLAQHFLDTLTAGQLGTPSSFSSKAIDLLLRFTWPENARDLYNRILAATQSCLARKEVKGADFGHLVTSEDFAPDIVSQARDNPNTALGFKPEHITIKEENALLREHIHLLSKNPNAPRVSDLQPKVHTAQKKNVPASQKAKDAEDYAKSLHKRLNGRSWDKDVAAMFEVEFRARVFNEYGLDSSAWSKWRKHCTSAGEKKYRELPKKRQGGRSAHKHR